ncbi:MAG: sugar phosphate isomerase/epimerase family protein [Planctomycetota bacterium]
MTFQPIDRRRFLATGAAAALVGSTALGSPGADDALGAENRVTNLPLPPLDQRYLLSCKLGMVTKEFNGRELTLSERFQIVKGVGFDGIDLDEAGTVTPLEARQASIDSGLFVHNAINHDHWRIRLTSPRPDEVKKGLANLEHCIRVSHAAGGSGVLLVVGAGGDGSADEIIARSREAIRGLLPMAAALGQHILFENVWNRMFYEHDAGPEQGAARWAEYVDSFNSPWVGMYYDIGNHWKYGQPGAWIRTLGKRIVKMDMKGFSRARNGWADIGEGDLPWGEVREALEEIGFCGWFTAEVSGGGPDRLAKVLADMKRVLQTG